MVQAVIDGRADAPEADQGVDVVLLARRRELRGQLKEWRDRISRTEKELRLLDQLLALHGVPTGTAVVVAASKRQRARSLDEKVAYVRRVLGASERPMTRHQIRQAGPERFGEKMIGEALERLVTLGEVQMMSGPNARPQLWVAAKERTDGQTKA